MFLDAKMFHSAHGLRKWEALHILLPIDIVGRSLGVCSLAEVSDPEKSRACLLTLKIKRRTIKKVY